MTSSAAQRRRSAYAAKAKAKQRRQKVIAIIGLVLFLGVLTYEVPKTLKLIRHSGRPTAAVVPHSQIAAPRRTFPKAFRGAAVDPFVTRNLSDGDPQVGPAVGGHDPFAQPGTPQAQSGSTSSDEPLPQQIVIGTPTKNGPSTRGWIVILASIPTRQGRSSAIAFARSARVNGVSSISVLNSSNRRPLRGGYWVVYTAPVPSLAAAERRAASVHAAGYGSAYLRELVVYK